RGRTGLHCRSAGLGLGLAICRKLVEAHRGSLMAFSPGEGFGSTFRLELVTVSAADVEADNAVPMTAAEPLMPLKILLVEDNQDTLRFFSIILSQRGHEVRKAANLLQARAMLTDDLDLLISDIELPDGSGLELSREFCERSLPAIAMSGFGSTEDIELSL